MDATQLNRLKKKLEEMESDLREAVEETDSTAPVQLDTSIGRLSRMDAMQSQQMARELKARQQQSLMRVRNALNSISSGTYGNCRRCKAPIPFDRLEAQPDAILCLKCAAQPGR